MAKYSFLLNRIQTDFGGGDILGNEDRSGISTSGSVDVSNEQLAGHNCRLEMLGLQMPT
jgi:hypothetical protein